MIEIANSVALTLAQTEGPGRGDNPSDVGGILIIVGVIVLAVLVIGTVSYLLTRATARRRGETRQGAGREG